MIKNLLNNWKTTSAGLTMIIGSVVHLVFTVQGHVASETVWTVSLTAIVAGLGLIFAGDASKSVDNHAETLQELAAIKSALKSGDTSQIDKPVDPPQLKP